MPGNHVYAELRCPLCLWDGRTEIEAEIDGRGFSKDYRLGDRVDTLPGLPRPEDTVSIDGYVVCDNCGRDYFVIVVVQRGILLSAEVNPEKKGYIT
ncbi:hypothetical protein L6R52_03950 [Myxococcota bacterium]|nr:hypothetical protein [Myxococcota bacterium]